MGQPTRVIVVVLFLLVGVGLFAVPLGSAATPSTIAVAVNGNTVQDGARVVVPQGNLSVSVTGDVELESVIVRIDGENYHEAHPNGTDYAIDLDPDFSSRSNAVEVIVTDANGALTNHQITVYRDTIAPDIGLTSPFEVSPGYQFPSVKEYTNTNFELVGSVDDASNITDFSARIVGSGQSVETTDLENGRFRLETTLVPGNNSLIVSATDEYGHRTYRNMRLEVTDDADPTLTVRGWPQRTADGTVTPTIVANDSVAVDSLVVQIPGQPEQTLVEPTNKLLDAGRTSVTVSPPLEFHRAGTYNVTFNVSDTVGHWIEQTKTIEYDPVTAAERVAPEIRIDEDRSGLYNDSAYRLFASVTNGTVRKVHLESDHQWEGVTYLDTLYAGSNISRYSIDEVVDIEPGRNVLVIEVTDALGHTHERQFVVETANASAYQPPTTALPETSGATESPTKSSPGTTTPDETRISVTEPTPLAPATGTSSPMSPLLSVFAFILAGLFVFRGSDRE